MEPADLRAARKRLGLTQKGLASALRMGTHGWQSISKWERDGGTVPGPVQVAVELLVARDGLHPDMDTGPVNPSGHSVSGVGSAEYIIDRDSGSHASRRDTK